MRKRLLLLSTLILIGNAYVVMGSSVTAENSNTKSKNIGTLIYKDQQYNLLSPTPEKLTILELVSGQKKYSYLKMNVTITPEKYSSYSVFKKEPVTYSSELPQSGPALPDLILIPAVGSNAIIRTASSSNGATYSIDSSSPPEYITIGNLT